MTLDAEGFYSEGNGYKWYLSWIGLGRWGFVLLKRILGVTIINPFFSLVVFFLCFPLSIIMWNALIEEWSSKQSVVLKLCFTGIYAVNAVWALQFAYRNQIEVCTIMMVLLPLGVKCFAIWIEEKKWIYCLSGFAIITFATSCYQAFLIMFMEGALIFFLFRLLHYRDKCIPERRFWYDVLKAFGFTVTVIVFYCFISRIVMRVMKVIPQDEYLTSHFTWTSLPVKENFTIISEYIGSRIFGNGIYTCIYSVTGMVLVIWCVYEALRKKEYRYPLLILTALLLFCPFLLAIVLPGGLVDRASFAFALSTAFMAWLFICIIDKALNKYKRCIYVCICCIVMLGVSQLQKTTRLLWTDVNVMTRDYEQMKYIYQRAIDCGASEWDSICFIGTRSNICTEAYLNYEVIGLSYFNIETDRNINTVDAMQAYRFPVLHATSEQIEYAKSIASDMECWPNPDSVRVIDNLIIVKMGKILILSEM